MTTDELDRYRYRLRFGKQGLTCYLSHHDTLLTLERWLRRSIAGLWFSRGFNPHPRISVPAALGVGISSRAEVAEFELVRFFKPARAFELLAEKALPGLPPYALELIAPSLVGQPRLSRYRAVLEEPFPPEKLAERLALPSLPIRRESDKGVREIEGRPFLRHAAVDGKEIFLDLLHLEGKTAKPSEILGWMETPPVGMIERIGLQLQDETSDTKG